MKTLTVAVALLVPFVAYAADEELPELTPQHVALALQEDNVYVFDNNDKETFKAGHVPHAKWLHPWKYDAKELPANKNATLIFYCYNEY